MPTYNVTTVNMTLTEDQKSDVAMAITMAHNKSTGAPGFFAQVIFHDVANGHHFIGGKLNDVSHIFVHGLIRAGRTADAKSGLMAQIRDSVANISGSNEEGIWVYIQDIEAEQMIEFGRFLPAPGEEEAWKKEISNKKREEFARAGVAI